MGMAASQARLLCLTARIHDVEHQAQSIQNAKLQLATQSDQVYQEYLDALDAQTMTLKAIDIKSGAQSTVAATFNNLCSINKLTPASSDSYALRDARGRLIVEDEIADGYAEYKSSVGTKSAEAFAFYMVFGDEGIGNLTGNNPLNDGVIKAEESTYQKIIKDGTASNTLINIRSQLEEIVGNSDIYNTASLKDEDKEKYNELLKSYRKELYSKNSFDVAETLLNEQAMTSISEEDFEAKLPEITHYISVYNQIQANGGKCIAISQFDGFDGDAANDSEWLTTMVQCGQISVELVKREKNGDVKFDTTSPSSDTCISYAETTSLDSAKLKKAEAKYENDLSKIEKKDKQYDLTLSKLDTERNALKTEYDSVKKVITDNIERTFGIFS
jgi:hypothetical protein